MESVTSTRVRDDTLRAALAGAATAAGSCQVVADHLLALGYPLPSVYLAQHGRLRCYGINGYWQLYDGIPSGVGVIGRTYVTGTPVVVRGADGHDAYVAVVDEEACVPVRGPDGSVIGVVNVEDHVRLPDDVVEVLSGAADLLAQRLDGIWDPDEASPLRLLAHHAVRVAEAGHHGQSVSRTLEAARDVAGTSSAMLALVDRDDDSGRWHVADVVGELSVALLGLGDEGLDRLAGWIAPGMSFFTMGAPHGERSLGGVESLTAAGVGSFAVVPLDAGGRRIGLLLVADRRVDPPTTDTIERLELLSALAAASLRTHQVLDDVRQLASRDALTGLGHHGSFHDDLRRAVQGPGGGPCVVLLDLDHFKDVNDSSGHPAGDEMLRRTARVLTSQLRGGDRAYRVGGDEFAVLMRADGAADAAAAVLRLHVRLTEALEPLTVSVGHALHVAGEDASTLVARADGALYAVKRSGRAGVSAATGPLAVPGDGSCRANADR